MEAVAAAGVPRLWEACPDADLKAKDLTLTPERPYRWVTDPGRPFTVTAASEREDARVVLTVWDWERRTVADRRLAGKCREDIRFEVSGRGTYLLTLDRFAGDACEARLVRSFSVCPSNEAKRASWWTSAFWPGACSFPGRQHWTNSFGPGNPPDLTEQQARELDAELSARLGLVLDRPDLPVTWPASDGPMDFTRADAALGAFTSRGFRLALQIGLPPGDWAALPQYQNVTDPRWRYPKTEESVRRFTRAAVAVQKLLYCWAHGNRAALLYASREIGGPRVGDWGYLDYFMCPRFSYGAVAAFMDTYAGAAFDRVVTEANGLFVYVFRTGGRLLVPVFVGADYGRPITLQTDAAEVTALDPMGNPSSVPVKDGRIAMAVGYYPATLVLANATRVELSQ